MKSAEFEPGDVVRLSRVTSVIEIDDGRGIVSENGSTYLNEEDFNRKDRSSYWKIELVERPVKSPSAWPPQAHDVWETEDGETYHCIYGMKSGMYAGSHGGHYKNNDSILQLKPVLVYRKGGVRP